MEALERIFTKPFEVTQFWASEEYSITGKMAGDTIGRLYRHCPEHAKKYQPPRNADWFFEVCDGDGGPFAGDFLPRILPTRANIAALNAACIKASKFLGAAVEEGLIEGGHQDDEALFVGLQTYDGGGPMTITNERYRKDLWRVFKDDWGLDLPPSDRFGMDPIVISHRPGLPCAAAMVRSVFPIIEATRGELKLAMQSTAEEGGRTFDIMEYGTSNGEKLTQRYDITELFGRDDLDWNYFHF